MLNWVIQFNIFCFLDNNNFESNGEFDSVLAIAGDNTIELSAANAYKDLKAFHLKNKGWLFGHLAYDLKNADPHLSSQHPDKIGFPDGFFFVPRIIIKIKNSDVSIYAEDPSSVFNAITETSVPVTGAATKYNISNRLSKEEYLASLDRIQEHIKRGDCYEINYCQEFFIENIQTDPLSLYLKLNNTSPNPFAAFYRLNNKYCMCASPERFLKKTGMQLISQPIKGTSKRYNDPLKDQQSFELLSNSEKDRSENVMIVDLVRNDLSKVCERNSVKATELFKIVPFPQVYQMISTVTGTFKNIHWTEALKATFPMGSMTGAPKHRVMQLIEQYEHTKRGLYSGTIGYVTPDDDFDFNVVIRSIFYNSNDQYLSFMAGGGITFKSDPENEYEECLMKTKAIKDVLSS